MHCRLCFKNGIGFPILLTVTNYRLHLYNLQDAYPLKYRHHVESRYGYHETSWVYIWISALPQTKWGHDTIPTTGVCGTVANDAVQTSPQLWYAVTNFHKSLIRVVIVNTWGKWTQTHGSCGTILFSCCISASAVHNHMISMVHYQYNHKFKQLNNWNDGKHHDTLSINPTPGTHCVWIDIF